MTNFVSLYQQRVENTLDTCLIANGTPARLADSMRYSTLDGGKRIRALLTYASGLTCGATSNMLDKTAAAIECIHAHSLIHDDLPAMDDDDLRRGKATNHIKFDEATAILAGDALLTLAFEIITGDTQLNDTQARQLCALLASAAGRKGMVGGQMLDILASDKQLNLNHLQSIHQAKTGALIKAAVMAGEICADNCNQQTNQALAEFGEIIGLAFQVVDDILDEESSTATLGKPRGSDAANHKLTYVALMGIAQARQFVEKLYQQAIASLRPISDNSEHLITLAELIVRRTH